jgi:hypothetical protein
LIAISVLLDALNAAKTIGAEGYRADALAAIAPRLSETLLGKALDAARAIHIIPRQAQAPAAIVRRAAGTLYEPEHGS